MLSLRPVKLQIHNIEKAVNQHSKTKHLNSSSVAHIQEDMQACEQINIKNSVHIGYFIVFNIIVWLRQQEQKQNLF